MTAPAAPRQPQQPPQPPATSPYAIAAAAASIYSAAQIVSAYTSQAAMLRQGVAQIMAMAWPVLGSYTDRDVDRWLAQVVPAIQGAQRAMATITDTYLEQLVATLDEKPAKPGSPPPTPPVEETRSPGEDQSRDSSSEPSRDRADATNYRGTDPREVYRRAVTEKFVREARGASADQAERSGFARAKQTALTDLQRAATSAALQRTKPDGRVVGYRRVLTGAENCGLCIVASTQRYRRGDLMPIHPNCDCVVVPIVGKYDPGRYINSAMLTGESMPQTVNERGVPVFTGDDIINLGYVLPQVHDAIFRQFGQAAADARRIDYRKVILTHDHGEIGPIIAVLRHKFTNQQMADRNLKAQPGTYGQSKRDFRR